MLLAVARHQMETSNTLEGSCARNMYTMHIYQRVDLICQIWRSRRQIQVAGLARNDRNIRSYQAGTSPPATPVASNCQSPVAPDRHAAAAGGVARRWHAGTRKPQLNHLLILQRVGPHWLIIDEHQQRTMGPGLLNRTPAPGVTGQIKLPARTLIALNSLFELSSNCDTTHRCQ